MDIIVDKEAGKMYVRLLDDPIKTETTQTLAKHGVILHWDGKGTLMGVEFKFDAGDPYHTINLREVTAAV